jgi:hypothetical protein
MKTQLSSSGAIRALTLLALSGLLSGAPFAYAGSILSKKDPRQAVSPSVMPQTPAAKPSVSKTLNRKRKPAAAIEKPAVSPPLPAARMARRRTKIRKAAKPVPIVQPKPDLSYYGMLAAPQRYAVIREPRKGQLPTPQTGELVQDHFLELDKNRDGLVDPFERSFGRLDMDRDLSNHQWE